MNCGPEHAGHTGHTPLMVRIPPDPALPAERQDWQPSWPRQDYLELPAVADAVPRARHHVRLVMREWQIRQPSRDGQLATELAYDVEQVTAELVANAVAATLAMPLPTKQLPVRLWMLGGVVWFMVAIWDPSTAVPVPRQPSLVDEFGRGLQLVDALAHWDYYLPSSEHGGKVVYARLPKYVSPMPPVTL